MTASLMPWCEECDTLVEEEDLGEKGSAPPAAPFWPSRSADRSRGTSRPCWSASVIYLGYRGYQGISWIAGHV